MRGLLLSIATAALVLVAPVNCFASSLPAYDMSGEVYIKVIDSERVSCATYEGVIEGREELKYTVAFVPKNVAATAYSKSIKVEANVTTAAKQFIIQYSTDKNFENDVVTKTYRNASYDGAVVATLKNSYVKTLGEGVYSTSVRTLSQGDENLTYREQKSYDAESPKYLAVNQSTVDAARKKITREKTFNIQNVTNGQNYYIRIRAQYEGLKGNKVYSQWVTERVYKQR